MKKSFKSLLIVLLALQYFSFLETANAWPFWGQEEIQNEQGTQDDHLDADEDPSLSKEAISNFHVPTQWPGIFIPSLLAEILLSHTIFPGNAIEHIIRSGIIYPALYFTIRSKTFNELILFLSPLDQYYTNNLAARVDNDVQTGISSGWDVMSYISKLMGAEKGR